MYFIDEELIHAILRRPAPAAGEVEDILAKAAGAKGLDLTEAAALLRCDDEALVERLFETARQVKEKIYGPRLVLFAPLYLSNECVNNCLYCGFRRGNQRLVRHTLSVPDAVEEARTLVRQGHKRLLLVCGEHPQAAPLDFVCDVMREIYQLAEMKGEIRRINVNMAPLDVEGFQRLKEAGIGTFQAFQETYHFETYKQMHPSGPKSNYAWRLFTMDRAMKGGIDDVGMGVLFGLYDHRFEVLALLQHVAHLEERFGVGCHTISVPRIEPALDAPAADHPPHAVSDREFKKLVAVLRLAVPYTGIILSTRERAEFRREVIALGVSQISAASRTFPGAYRAAEVDKPVEEQFHLGDTRSLDEVIRDITRDGYVPSFCTACYRSGRTGSHFMELAKPGDIHQFCQPNAILSTAEYLLDYATPEAAAEVWPALERAVAGMPSKEGAAVSKKLERLKAGERDLYL